MGLKKDAIVRLKNAGVRFGSRWIFQNMSLEVPIGRCLAILGPNGRGKTTLLRALLGFQALAEGERDVPPVIGYVPQSGKSDIGYPVRQIVAMGRVAKRGLFASPGRADGQAADKALHRVGIESLSNKRFDRLSGGERQLVWLAQAIATGATTLILDEPASALDLRNQDRFLTVLNALRAGGEHAILFTTHLPQHALAAADDALLMYDEQDRLFGSVTETITEVNVARLYGLPIRIVAVEQEGKDITHGIIPLFGQKGREPRQARAAA